MLGSFSVGFLKYANVFNNRGGKNTARKKNSKYTKTENNLTADHELLPKQQNTTDYLINMPAVTS